MLKSEATKSQIAAALEARTLKKSFSKISITDICNDLNINRKTFYYHYKNKSDVVIDIFHENFLNKSASRYGWDYLQQLCEYLGKNKVFYIRVLTSDDCNDFQALFSEQISRHLQIILHDINDTFVLSFYTHAVKDAIFRWISLDTHISAKMFICYLKKCFFVD